MDSQINDFEFFSNIPWCQEYLNEPNTIQKTPPSCERTPDGENDLFADSLRSLSTIRAFLAIYKLPESPPALLQEAKFLISLETGLTGYPGYCHGGIIATILDEILGVLFVINKRHNNLLEGNFMTGQLNVKFIKPVEVPGTYLCRANISRSEGRKYFVDGSIEDENGTVLACGESVYIGVKQKL